MSDPALILIVEDEPKIARLLEDYLQQSNYETHWLDGGLTADDWCKNNNPDIVLLDLMLPGKDGLAVCRELRSHSQVPIIMVTARVDEIDRLLGLELGADDYICKPFSPREVVARVKALLRRVEMIKTNPTTAYRGLSIDDEKFSAIVDGQALDLTPVEFRLLALLASQPGRVFSRDQLMNNIYLDGRVVSDRTVDSHVKNLRQKINDVVGSDELIRSIYGVGYKLE
jgi:two-component system response regulator BaeR